jgi:acyl dehydratase
MSNDVLSVSDVEVGQELPARTIHISRASLVQYTGASLDRNQIHWDERFARSVGLPDVIAHGMFTMGSAINVVSDWVGDAGRVVEYGVRFTRPVVVPYESGADVEVTAVVKAVDAETRRATVELTARCGADRVLGRALAVVALN